MKFTRKMVRAIKAACREACGGRRRVEIGERTWDARSDEQDGFNFLLWGDGNDLDQTVPVDGMVNSRVADSDGWVALDCYCYNLPLFGQEPDDILDTNVYVLLNPAGEAVYASCDDLGHSAAINEILTANGHPGYQCAD